MVIGRFVLFQMTQPTHPHPIDARHTLVLSKLQQLVPIDKFYRFRHLRFLIKREAQNVEVWGV